ncbi:YggT family protein [Nocardioides alcanivorans]|uniref:YggT family protein n=1 Tax=Nocardioides alcanivorans TaxID=2897352 RepID=UPI001F3F3D2F|nr:YggT family protein [Nocardioides alcanivorans]
MYLYLVVTEIVLTLGFFLLLFGANPGPPFVQWAYRSLDRAMEPFRGIFTSIELGQTGNQVEAVLDTSIIFAMIVYGIIAWSVHAGIDWLADRIAHLDRLDEQARRDRAQAQATQQAQAQWAQASQATPEQTRQYPPADPDRA